MICEYALEPELVATWHTDLHYFHFIKHFGFDPDDGRATGRVVAQYPRKSWNTKVLDAFDANSGYSAKRFAKKKRIEILLEQLGRPRVRRSGSTWNDQYTWLENAEEENKRHQFHAILACNPSDNPQIVCGEDVLPEMESPPLWSVPREEPVLRTAASMATHLKPMLRCATRILFVDPHFRPSELRYRNPLEQFLKIICDGSRDVTLEYHTRDTISQDTLQKHCQQYLPRIIPPDFTLTVRRWKERDTGEELHDRYILTDIGGVKIPRGLDESKRYDLKESERGTIDISRLSYETWQQRLEDYGYYDKPDSSDRKKPSFNLEGQPIVIEGRRNIR